MAIDETINSVRLDGMAMAAQSRSRVPAVVLAAAHGGSPVGVGAAGYADVELGGVASAQVPFRIGSITKTFTAAAMLCLSHEGRLSIDEPLGAYLTGTPFADVPLRSLLAHRGGVQREAPGSMWDTMQGPDTRQLRRSLPKAELVAVPGTRWHYSNLGYALLGLVIEEVTGQPCPAVVEDKFVKPLGLPATSWERPPAAARGYRVDPYGDVVHREPDMDQGAVGVGGQMWSTAADLLAWGDVLAGGVPDLLPPTVVDAMHTLEVMVDGTGWTQGWGLGLILERRGDRVIAGHTGAMPGFVAALWVDRRTRSVAVALSNATRGAAVGNLAADLLDRVAGDGLLDDTSPGAADVAPWSPLTSTPDDVDGVLGRWWSESAETVFTWRADGLHARLVDAPENAETMFEQLDRDSYRAVRGRFNGERLLVLRGPDGAVERLVWATYPFTRTPR